METNSKDAGDDKLKQLKAYKVGYDLGWYRALESVSNDLQKMADCILNSHTIREIEREGGDKPIFLAKVLSITTQISEMRAENLPTLLLERKAITSLGEGLQKVLMENQNALDTSEEQLKQIAENNNG